MIDTAFAERFAHEWVEAWNSHDLEAVLSPDTSIHLFIDTNLFFNESRRPIPDHNDDNIVWH